jgi:hypothetical protein
VLGAFFLGLSWKRRKKGGGRRVAWRRELHVEIKQRMGSRARCGGEKVQEGGHAERVTRSEEGDKDE